MCSLNVVPHNQSLDTTNKTSQWVPYAVPVLAGIKHKLENIDHIESDCQLDCSIDPGTDGDMYFEALMVKWKFINAWTKWPNILKNTFSTAKKLFYFSLISLNIEMCFGVSNWRQYSICLDNGSGKVYSPQFVDKDAPRNVCYHSVIQGIPQENAHDLKVWTITPNVFYLLYRYS